VGPDGRASRYLEIDDRIARPQLIAFQQLAGHTGDAVHIDTGNTELPEAVAEPVEMPSEREELAAVRASDLINPVSKKESPVVRRYPHVLLRPNVPLK